MSATDANPQGQPAALRLAAPEAAQPDADRGRRNYHYYGRSGSSQWRFVGFVLSGLGVLLSGTAVLIVVLRQSPQPATHAIAVEPTASHLRLATALGRLVQEPQVSEKLKKHVADWVEGEQFRRMQMELAIYIKSERFHDLLINSFRGFQRGQGATSAANGMSVD